MFCAVVITGANKIASDSCLRSYINRMPNLSSATVGGHSEDIQSGSFHSISVGIMCEHVVKDFLCLIEGKRTGITLLCRLVFVDVAVGNDYLISA